MQLLSILLAVGVSAGAIVRRDLATIQGVMTTVGQDIDGLDSAVKSFSGDPAGLLTASNKFIQDLKDGNTKITPTGELSLTDALALQNPAKDLQTKGQTLVNDLKAKLSAFESAGLCEVTFTQASAINTNSQALIKTIVGKVPPDAQSIAQGIVAPLLQELQEAQDAFSPANCKDSGSPPPSSGAPTGSAPPTSGGSAPTSSGGSAPTSGGVPPTTSAPSLPTSMPGSGTCPAASTVTVTATDSKDCTAKPTCTASAPVTITTTTTACPKGSSLPW